MRYVRAGGIVLSVGLLLAGLGLANAQLTRASLLLCAAAMTVCFLEKPGLRAAWYVPALCLMLSGWQRLLSLTDAPMFVLPAAQGDWLVPAGESAYRTYAACVLAVAGCAWLGETAVETLLARPSREDAGWAGAPVRIVALLPVLLGAAVAAAPALSEWVVLPAIDPALRELLFGVAAAALVCYCAAARFRALAFFAILLYLVSAAFDSAVFAQRALLSALLALLTLARCGGWLGLAGPALVGAVLTAVLIWPADSSALSLYALRLRQELLAALAPGENLWIVRLWARLGYPGLCAAGAIGGALCFFLGRLLRDSFVYAAPSLAALSLGSRALLKGEAALPTLTEAVLFGSVWGVCLIVGCIRRSQKRASRR